MVVSLSPATILRKSPLLLRSAILSPPKPPPSLNITTPPPYLFRISTSRAFPPRLSCRCLYSISTHTSFYTNKGLGFFGSRFKPDDKGFSRVSAGSGGDGGAGGSGGGDGGSGGFGNDGGNNSKWSLLSWYLELLAKFPVVTKAITSACLTLIGDVVCQFVIDKVQSLDYKRTFMFTFLGLVLVGPTLHFWYLYLSKLVTLPGAGGALLRLLLDQFLFAPVFIGVFLSSLVALEGRPAEVIPKLKQEWFSSVQANWLLWIPVQFLNFRFVPQQFQVLASNFVSLIWNVILSFKAHKEVSPK